MLWILAVFLCIPQLALASCNPIYSDGIKWKAVIIDITAIVTLRITVALKKNRAPKVTRDYLTLEVYHKIVFIVSLIALSAILLGYAVTSISFDWFGQYDRRISFRSEVSPFIGSGYLFTWLGGVLEPLLFAIGILWRKKSYLILAIVIAVISFSLNGAKSSAFSWILSLVVVILSLTKWHKIKSFPIWGFSLIIGNLLATSILTLFHNPFLALLIPRRLGIMPAQITIDYIRWSEVNGFTYFTQNLLKFFVSAENRVDVTRLVGLNWSSTGNTNSNANAWADGYMSMGLIGVFLITLFMSTVLRIADNLAMTKNFALVTSVMITTLVTWVNVAFSTSMLTNGILFALILLKLSPSDQHAEQVSPIS
jgi:hypothetical protein